MRLLIIMATPVLLLVLVLLSYGAASQRSYDTQAANAVMQTGQALQRVQPHTAFAVSIVGPRFIPGLAGPPVPEGVTLCIWRWRSGETYVRGSHREGTATYYFHNGKVYADEAAPSG